MCNSILALKKVVSYAAERLRYETERLGTYCYLSFKTRGRPSEMHGHLKQAVTYISPSVFKEKVKLVATCFEQKMLIIILLVLAKKIYNV